MDHKDDSESITLEEYNPKVGLRKLMKNGKILLEMHSNTSNLTLENKIKLWKLCFQVAKSYNSRQKYSRAREYYEKTLTMLHDFN